MLKDGAGSSGFNSNFPVGPRDTDLIEPDQAFSGVGRIGRKSNTLFCLR